MAQAVAYLNKHATIFGGAQKGTTWQVVLPKGKYYVVSINSAGEGNPIMASLKVTGKTGSTTLHDTGAAVTAAKPNVWKTKGLSQLGKGWLRFRNTSKELHFMDLSGVKAGTTKAQVKRGLQRPQHGAGLLHQQELLLRCGVPRRRGRGQGSGGQAGHYLLDCFMPSQTDGTPHAFMGMWKLVEVGRGGASLPSVPSRAAAIGMARPEWEPT